MSSKMIKNQTLNFEAKAWWILDRHRLCPTTRDNVLIPVCATLVVGLMVGYKLDVSQFITREIWDRTVGTENEILAFPYLLTYIFLDARVTKLLEINQFDETNSITDLG